ncbi:MAG: virulence RhuM family protein [Betaproteobacteria bacterium]|nr:virulence RhuM family protein [Betaproteobacteria bacterium]
MGVREIVDRFGGQSDLARAIGKGQSTVAYWVKTGAIPDKWHAKLLEIANQKGIPLALHEIAGGVLEPLVIEASGSSRGRSNAVFVGEALNPPIVPEESDFLFYSGSDGAVRVQVLLRDETVWASQKAMSDIFGTSRENVTIHLGNVFSDNELDELSVSKDFLLTGPDGKNYTYKLYSLDAIISVGYRVNSYQATQFRRWATGVLKSYLIKGFALDDDRLKQGSRLFGKDYFDELLERIREIRASERRFYQKITDIYAQCSVDYDKHSQIAQMFYAHVQDKLHYAIHGHTAAELIEQRADAKKPHMGLTSFKNEKLGGKVTKLDVTVGKNYLNEAELTELNRLVGMYLDFAEGFARRRIPMKMTDWSEKLDAFLKFNAYEVLENFGQVSREHAEARALAEYEKFREIQDKEFSSDFDKIVEKAKLKQLPKGP